MGTVWIRTGMGVAPDGATCGLFGACCMKVEPSEATEGQPELWKGGMYGNPKINKQ